MIDELIKACLADFKSTDPGNLIVLSYPKVYGTGSGPFGGPGGATITSFHVVVVVDWFDERATVYLAGPAKKRMYDLRNKSVHDIFWKKFQEQGF